MKKLLPPLLLLLGLATFTTAQITCIAQVVTELSSARNVTELTCTGEYAQHLDCLETYTSNPFQPEYLAISFDMARYIIYKLPKITKVGKTQVNDERVDGFHYLYTDNRIISDDREFRLSSHSLHEMDGNSAVQRTLTQLYDKTSEVQNSEAGLIYVMYNDQFPGKQASSASYGHAKGVTAFGSKTGFWMVHSVPHFPNDLQHDRGYEWPGNGLDNGQVMLCISLTTSSLEEVSVNMVLRQVYAYETHVEGSVLVEFISQQNDPTAEYLQTWKGNVVAALKEIRNKDTTVSKSELITRYYPGGTVGPYVAYIDTYNPQERRTKQRVHFIAKTSGFGVNFYNWLAEMYYIKRVVDGYKGMRVQTWRRGSGGPLPNYCPSMSYSQQTFVPTFMVQNVKVITATNTLDQPNSKLKDRNGNYDVPFVWSYTKDHSKWGIGISSRDHNGVVCIGDLNRVFSQGIRAGGAICIPNDDVYEAFNKLIPNNQFYEECP